MNVYFVIFDITKAGGTERSLINLANTLEDKTYNITIISLLKSKKTIFFALDSNVKVVYLSNLTHLHRWTMVRLVQYIKLFKEIFFLKTEPRTIWIGTCHAINILLLPVCLTKRFNLIGMEHIPFGVPPILSRFIRSISYRYLSELVILSEKDLVNYQKINCKISIIPNSLPFYPEYPATLESKVIIAIGRFSPEKNFKLLIEACSIVLKKHNDWKLKIFGNGRAFSQISSLIKKNDMERNIFLKGFTHDVENELMSSSIYVMSSVYEEFPISLLEAMACGLPTVSTPCGGVEMIIDTGIEGYIVKNHEKECLANKIDYLVCNKSIRKSMSFNARKKVYKFRPEVISNYWKDLLVKYM